MTNEEIVRIIKNGNTDPCYLEALYNNNLQLIKRIIKPYTQYEPMDDLLQESFFGLVEAVKHFDTASEFVFMTYARYWIVKAVSSYLRRFGSCIRLPSAKIDQITKYKAIEREHLIKDGSFLTVYEIAEMMDISVDTAEELRILSSDIESLDSKIITAENEDISFGDTLIADFNTEEDTVNKLYDDDIKKNLWSAVNIYLLPDESFILKEYFGNGKSLSEIAKAKNVTRQCIHNKFQRALNKLKADTVTRRLSERFEIIDSGIYDSGIGKYRRRDFTSNTEFIAIKHLQTEDIYYNKVGKLLNTV